jgi:glycosyltransferase involved in cell wall biosynthesis
MRILYLHQYFNTPQDSGGTRSYEMARRLVAAGHDVDMITSARRGFVGSFRGWRQTEEAEIRVHWLSVPYANVMSYAERIRAFIQFAWGAAFKAASLEVDVVFATSTPLTIAFPAVYAARRQNIPMVFEVRDLWPEVPIAVGALKGWLPIRAARWLERFAYRNSDCIVALSPGMKQGITRTGYPKDRVHVIPNSADLELFDVPATAGKAFRAQFDWLKDRPLVVYTGALGLINGVAYMAHLAAVVEKQAPEVRFLVLGEGKEERRVSSIARELGVLGRSFFMMPPIPKVEIPKVLSAADVATSLFVINVPALWANSANKFFDALASGTPVAINYRGWQANLIEQRGAGIVLKAQDIEAAADQIVQKLQNRSWLERAGAAARKLAEERFSRDMLAQRLEAVLLRAIESY